MHKCSGFLRKGKRKMKIAVIGGGGVRSMFLAKSLLQHGKELGFTEIVFMDNDPVKLDIFGRMSAEVAKRIDPEILFRITGLAEEAIRDADYIITTIRVGGDKMRVKDERLALDLGILGQETTGAAGFSFAMRSVPALADICELARIYAKPEVKIFNFTNPAGVVSQTLRDMGYNFTYGICDAPSGLLRSIANIYHVDPEHITGDCYGLNHLSYFKSIKLDGREVLPELLNKEELYTSSDMRYFGKDLVEELHSVLNEYLYYYYYRQEAVDNILKAGSTRGELICEINRLMIQELSHLDPERDFDTCLKVFDKWYGKREDAYMEKETGCVRNRAPYHFDLYEKDDGGYAGVALRYIRAVITGKETEMILCVPNGGAIKELRNDDVVEVTCTIRDGRLVTHPVDPDPMPMQLIRQVKLYERLASLAIRTKSRKAALECLMVHPLVNSYSFAKKLTDEYISSNAAYSSGWL